MTSYNQSVQAQNVRIGNWLEEQKLQEDTGIRYRPDPTIRKSSLLTYSRCIEHSDKIEPKDYTTVTRATLPDPSVYKQDKKRDPVGPKRRMLEASIKKQIDEEIERKTKDDFTESRRLSYLTATKESFNKPNFTASLKENDSSIRLPTKNTNYTTDSAITIYSHALKDPKQKIFFPTSFTGSTNPLRKNNYFSADIRSNQLNIRSETEERPSPLPTVEQFKILSLFMSSLMEIARNEIMKTSKNSEFPIPGEAIRYIIVAFYSFSSDVISLQDFEMKVLQEFFQGIELRQSERKALLCAFDAHSDGYLVIADMIKFIKRTPVPRRIEIIDFFFALAGPDSQGTVSIPSVVRKINSAGLSANHYARRFLNYLMNTYPEIEQMQEYTMNDFYNYYLEASNEIENDENFEEFMKESWNFMNLN
jgi:Ca2+-binding EF-hand superfamily protein